MVGTIKKVQLRNRPDSGTVTAIQWDEDPDTYALIRVFMGLPKDDPWIVWSGRLLMSSLFEDRPVLGPGDWILKVRVANDKNRFRGVDSADFNVRHVVVGVADNG